MTTVPDSTGGDGGAGTKALGVNNGSWYCGVEDQVLGFGGGGG